MSLVIADDSMPRAARANPPRRGRKPRCSCGGIITHTGTAGGVGMMQGCELCVWRWVRSPNAWARWVLRLPRR